MYDICKGRSHGVEENIKVGIVIPVLECLGYRNPQDMDFEHVVGPKSADIALLVGAKPVLIAECKSMEIDLDRFKGQGLEYARKKGIEWTLMTNGVRFQLYKSFISGVSDERNEPIFSTTLRRLLFDFPKMYDLIGKPQVKDIAKKVQERIQFIRRKITEEEFLDEVKSFKRQISERLRTAFIDKYKNDKGFALRVDSWLETNNIDKDWSWIGQIDSDSDFSKYILEILAEDGVATSKDLLKRKYQRDPVFTDQVDKVLRANDMPIDWTDRLCGEGAYAFVNRLVFMRMYEDRVLRRAGRGLAEDYLPLLEKATSPEMVARLIAAMFGTMEKEFPGMYTSPLFDGVFLSEIEWDPNLINSLVRKTRAHDFSAVDRDILGEVYQKHVSKHVRKALGQFYTSPSVVRYVFDQLSEWVDGDSRILDPACGSGTFLTEAYDRLSEKRRGKNPVPDSSHVELLTNCLWGIDIDSFATQLATMNLLLKDLNHPCDIPNIVTGNSLDDNLSRWSSESSPKGRLSGDHSPAKTIDDVLKYGYKTGFDVVVGNPPHRVIRKDHSTYQTAIEREFSDVVGNRVNLAVLFTKRGLRMTKPGGVFAMILPKPIAWNMAYKPLRDYISNKCTILEITDLGKAWDEVGQEQVILFAKKPNGNDEGVRDRGVRIVSGVANVELLEHGEYREHFVEREAFGKWPAFPMYLNNAEYPDMRNIWKKVYTGTKPLREIAAIYRGYGAQSSNEVTESPKKGFVGLLRGEHIGKAGISERWAIETPGIREFIYLNSKKLDTTMKWRGKSLNKKRLMLENDRIVAKRLVSSDVKIDAAMNPKTVPLLNFDTVANVTVMDDTYDPWFILGVLNSNLARVFIRDIVFVRSILTMDLDDAYLGQLPIPKQSHRSQREISTLAKGITAAANETFEKEYNIETSHDLINANRRMAEMVERLHLEVSQAYGLTAKEHDVITALADLKLYSR